MCNRGLEVEGCHQADNVHAIIRAIRYLVINQPAVIGKFRCWIIDLNQPQVPVAKSAAGDGTEFAYPVGSIRSFHRFTGQGRVSSAG